MERFAVGEWLATPATGELANGARCVRVEPKVMDLLCVLAQANGEVVTHEALLRALWPRMVVTEDTIARTVSRLRQALGDSSRAPRYVGTVPKRGYRLLVATRAIMPLAQPEPPPQAEAAALPAPAPIPALTAPIPPTPSVDSPPSPGRRRRLPVLPAAVASFALAVACLAVFVPRTAEPRAALARADDFYFQFSYADNQAAIALYRRILDDRPDFAPACAGLASALAQDAIRWPGDARPGSPTFRRLRDALHAGSLATPAARARLALAREHAERAVALAPGLAAAYRARGLVRTAQGDLTGGLRDQERAAALDPDAWGALINVADVQEMLGRDAEALASLERAYAAMRRAYVREPARVRPWQPRLGVLIGERRYARGDAAGAERAWREVLDDAPYDPDATAHLAALLTTDGRPAEAREICAELVRRRGASVSCPAPAGV